MRPTRKTRALTAERDYWKMVALGLSYAGFCEHCDSMAATHLDNCPDKQNWHKYYTQLPEIYQ